MGVMRRLEVRSEMHCTGISNAFLVPTTNLHTSQILWCSALRFLSYASRQADGQKTDICITKCTEKTEWTCNHCLWNAIKYNVSECVCHWYHNDNHVYICTPPSLDKTPAVKNALSIKCSGLQLSQHPGFLCQRADAHWEAQPCIGTSVKTA